MKTYDSAVHDIEELIEDVFTELRTRHDEVPAYLILGRLAYEHFRDMALIGKDHTHAKVPHRYKSLEVVIVEEPDNMVLIGCKPD